MTFAEFRYLVLSDLYRIYGSVSVRQLLMQLFFGEGFKFIFWLRAGAYTRSVPWLKYSLYLFCRLMLKRLTYKLGISIPVYTEIGSGFMIGHFGGIVVNGRCVIGKNCNLSHGVTLGQANRGRKSGYPVVGDNVFIGPGAKIIGAVRIGNNAAIGPNCVVVADVPDSAVVVGIPGRVLSSEGSSGYVNRTDYEGIVASLRRGGDVRTS